MVIIIKKGTDKHTIQKALNRLKRPKGFNAFKYCGKAHLEKDPLAIQKTLRDEWV